MNIPPLTPDEYRALIWAARNGAHNLRSEGWKDMQHNANILDSARLKLEKAYPEEAKRTALATEYNES